MARKAAEFTADLWEKAGNMLAALPEKPKEKRGLTAKDGLAKIEESIRVAQEAGYTYDEIVSQLKTVGIEISLTTFKTYWNSGKKKRAKPATTRKTSSANEGTATAAVQGPASGPVSAPPSAGKAPAEKPETKPADRAPKRSTSGDFNDDDTI